MLLTESGEELSFRPSNFLPRALTMFLKMINSRVVQKAASFVTPTNEALNLADSARGRRKGSFSGQAGTSPTSTSKFELAYLNI